MHVLKLVSTTFKLYIVLLCVVYLLKCTSFVHLIIANNSGMIPGPQAVFLHHQVGAIGWHLKALVCYLCDLALVQSYAIGQWPSLVYLMLAWSTSLLVLKYQSL
jgi:hypothetical protein